MSIIKAMGIGMVVGSVVGLAIAPRKKKMTVGKALRSVGNMVDNVAGSFGF